MTQENKELLLKDLCARLPYGVKVEITHWRNRDKGMIDSKIFRVPLDVNKASVLIKSTSDVRPYLFPLSSMTDEQKKEYDSIIYHGVELHCERYYNVIDVDCFEELQEFYHKNHLDYRNLIGFGLAIDATGLNIY